MLFCCSYKYIYAQNKAIDSMLVILKSAKEDTNKVKTLIDLSESLWRTDGSEQGIKFAREALELSEKINYKRGILEAYNFIGLHYSYMGNRPEALKNYFIALKKAEDLGDKNEIAYCYLLLGAAYRQEGVTHPDDSLGKEFFNKALKYDFAALKILQQTGHKWYTCITYNNIGAVYMNQGNSSEALKNYLAALKIAEELGAKSGAKRQIAITSHNISSI